MKHAKEHLRATVKGKEAQKPKTNFKKKNWRPKGKKGGKGIGQQGQAT